ncbi:TPA: hypothetical protein HA235_00310 [Candidatus Woesearchaeota archaeon]|nr:hypothetical protein [Candidatus Woesearchaeota archaeon]HIH31126.1 hypothetical protein [Candidatus Woesearchaeota archaeon]HIH54607.1 hypothetical protein [Candidatus Woesearchaeota archaeon]HIJ02339.1 hypothetical protein [Candidatus Woesearchaeota archaeon]HIJ14183.1 hypothetical protein [Candidatus Woesearchaeota archaeon]
MQFKEYFYTLFKSLNPESYSELSERKLSEAFKYFLFIFIASFIVMLLLFIPSLLAFNSFWEQKSVNLNQFELDASINVNNGFYLLKDPSIKIDKSDANFTDARVMITEDSIHYRSLFFFGKTKVLPLPSYDLKDTDTARSLLYLLLPSLIIWGFILFFAYFVFLILFTWVIGFVIVYFLNNKITAKRLLKIVFFASTILVSIQLVLLPFFRLLLLPVIAYWILILIIIFTLKDHVQESRNVFRNKDEKIEVDDSGNIKSKKRKKSYDEENDGYVEWK